MTDLKKYIFKDRRQHYLLHAFDFCIQSLMIHASLIHVSMVVHACHWSHHLDMNVTVLVAFLVPTVKVGMLNRHNEIFNEKRN